MNPIVQSHESFAFVERRDEPEVAGCREEEAGVVVGAAPESDEAGEDEREAGGHGERGDEPGPLVVRAREDERDCDGCLEQRATPAMPKRRALTGEATGWPAPESSPFGTKPIARLDSICEP